MNRNPSPALAVLDAANRAFEDCIGRIEDVLGVTVLERVEPPMPLSFDPTTWQRHFAGPLRGDAVDAFVIAEREIAHVPPRILGRWVADALARDLVLFAREHHLTFYRAYIDHDADRLDAAFVWFATAPPERKPTMNEDPEIEVPMHAEKGHASSKREPLSEVSQRFESVRTAGGLRYVGLVVQESNDVVTMGPATELTMGGDGEYLQRIRIRWDSRTPADPILRQRAVNCIRRGIEAARQPPSST